MTVDRGSTAGDDVGEPQTRATKVAHALVELADNLVADFDVVELLSRLSEHCIDVLDVDAAGIMLADVDGRLHVVASSSEAMRLLELFEIQASEGPCSDCFATGRPVINEDLTTADHRWPRFAAEAIPAGFRVVHAFPLRLRDTVLGALNLFQFTPQRLRPDDVDVAQALGDVAAIAILQHRAAREAHLINEQLNGALNTRIAVEQAKGMVAEHEHLDMERAFARLRAHASRHDLRLADVAAAVVAGTLAATDLERLESPD